MSPVLRFTVGDFEHLNTRINRVKRFKDLVLGDEMLHEIGEKGVDILKEEIPLGETGALREGAMYNTWKIPTRYGETGMAHIGWWTNTLTEDRMRLDKIVNRWPDEPEYTKGSPGRYVPVLGKRLKERKTTYGLGRMAARGWAKVHGLKFPYKAPRIRMMRPEGEDSGWLYGLFFGQTTAERVPDERASELMFGVRAGPSDILLNPETSGYLDAKRMDMIIERGGVRLRSEMETTSYHEHIHAILEYNRRYGTRAQKWKVSQLIVGGYDDPNDILRRQTHEWYQQEEAYIQEQEAQMYVDATTYVAANLKRHHWQVGFVTAESAKLQEFLMSGGRKDETPIGYIRLAHHEYGTAEIAIWRRRWPRVPEGSPMPLQMTDHEVELGLTGQKYRAEVLWLGTNNPRRGYGRKTFQAAKSILKSMGITQVTLESVERSRGFWRKMGFSDERAGGKSYRPFETLTDEPSGLAMATDISIGWHPGSKRTPFYTEAAKKIRPMIKEVLVTRMKEMPK